MLISFGLFILPVIPHVNGIGISFGFYLIFQFVIVESLSMAFTSDGKRQRLPLIFFSFLVILE